MQNLAIKNRSKMQNHLASTASGGFYDDQQSVLLETLYKRQEHLESKIEGMKTRREKDFKVKNELLSLRKND